MTVRSEMCGGSGSWTKIPWKRSSAFSLATSARSSSWVVVAASSNVSLKMPASSQARRLLRT